MATPPRPPADPARAAVGRLIPLAACWLALAGLAGCATTRPARDAELSAGTNGAAETATDATAHPVAMWDTLGAASLPAERQAWLAEHEQVSDMEELYRQAVGLVARDLLDPADDLLYELKRTLALPAPEEADSLTLAYRKSLDRRLILLAGLCAEARALRGDWAPADSLLESVYADLRGLVLPDTLVTLPQGARRALEEQLLAVDNQLVREWIDHFCGAGRANFARWLERRAQIEPIVTGILTEAGLPPELFYLSVIESGLSPTARSNVGAVGYWQFMPGTARHFSLRRDWWVDERRDLELSTRAAATYLSQLYAYFQNWPLVLAAYNAGEGRVDRIIQRAGHRDFWRLPLPEQTRHHIPKFIAAYRIGMDPARYGFAALEPRPLQYDTVRLDTPTDLKVLARCAGVDEEQLRALNPALLRGVSPPGATDYAVRVPAGSGEETAAKLAALPPNERLTWLRHTVRRGDTLSLIASRYGSSVQQLRDVNRLGRSSLIHPGQQLVVPVTGGGRAAADARLSAETSPTSLASADAASERVSYRVRRGDTLSGIARKLGVSLAHLRRENDLRGNLIRPGQRLYARRPLLDRAG